MKGRLRVGAAVLAAAAIAMPLGAQASSIDTKLQIGSSLHFTGPDSSAGTFVAAGAVRDSGTSVVTGLHFTPRGNQDDLTFGGTQTFVGQRGSITAEFKGVAGPAGDVHQAGQGTFEIVAGTGAYAGLHGQGTFLVVVDNATNQIIATEDGQAN